MIRFFLLLMSACLATGLYGQSADVYQVYKEKFPDEPAVYVDHSEMLNILVEGDSLRIFADVYEDLLLLKEQGDMFSGKRVYGSHFTHVENIKAKTLIWDKNRYKEMNVSDFKKNSDRDRGIFYDDSYYYSFNFPAVASRNRTQLQYRENLKDARFIPGYIFSSYLPQGKTTFTIKTSKDVELYYEVLHDTKHQIEFKKTEKGGYVLYEWTGKNLPGLKSDDNSPSLRYYAPHLVCYVKSYQTKKGKVNVINTLDDLYNWYYTFIEKLNTESSPELNEVVARLKASSTSELDLVKRVHYWVQDNIQYVAFEQGMRGLIPHHGSYVCEKRYGDCKDMANLIVNMLQLAGVKAYHTWIGTRDLPYKYSELPTPMVDNHMIATYISKNGDYYFLDATSDHTPFGLPSSMIQGKEALIGMDAKHYEVKTVPVITREKNFMTDSMNISIDKNELVGKGSSTLHGFPKVFGGYELDRAEKDDVKKYVTKLVGKGSNKFYLDAYTVVNLEDRDKPTQIDYTFRVADYFQKIGDEVYVNLNMNKDYYNTFINTDIRTTPKENDYQYEKYEVIDLVIPADYTVEYLPSNSTYDGTLLGYNVSYVVKDNVIRFSKKFYLNYLLMTPDQFHQWNEAVRKISEVYKESIILKKKP